MKRIKISKGFFTLVDDEDYAELRKHRWQGTSGEKRRCYVFRRKVINGKKESIIMHRLLLNAPPYLVVDHINHNPLDNRKRNLRLSTQAQNSYNQVKSRTTNRMKGVYRRKNRYISQVEKDGVSYFCGSFIKLKDAALAYDKKSKELFGEYASLNFSS